MTLYCRVCGAERDPADYLRACERAECRNEAARREEFWREEYRHEREMGEWSDMEEVTT